jgi:phospholipid-translocating ATPase
MSFPPLYQSLQRGRELTPKSFLMWLCKSIYQAFVIITMAVLFFESPMVNMVTITFTALIFTQILNVISEISKMNWIVVGSCIGSLVTYLLCLVILPELLDVAKVLDGQFIYGVTITVLVAWLPLYLLNYLAAKFYPSEEQRLMQQVAGNGGGFLDRVLDKLMFWRKSNPEEVRRELIEMN